MVQAVLRVSAFSLIELHPLRRLLPPHAARDDIRLCVILAAHRETTESAKHRQLTGVRERIGDRTLKQLLG